jgi:uncharacterized phage-associated protein
MHSPLAIANAIVVTDPGRTAMAVNKLVHLVHGWSLANGRSVVTGEAEVWRYGPVYRDVYEAFANFGHDPIGATMPRLGSTTIPLVPEDDQWTWAVVRQVVEHYRHDDACALSEICHAKDSAWRRVAERHGFAVRVGTTIPEADMAEHFRRKLSISRGMKARAARAA